MHGNSCPESLSQKDLDFLIQHCLKVEQDRNLSDNSLKELERYLSEFGRHCKNHGALSSTDLNPDFFRAYADHRCRNAGPNLKKAVVWSLRKFGQYLSLMQIVTDDPAKNLRHPKFHPRSELPEYLSETELRMLLGYAACRLEKRDFAVISLMTTTGLRPHEIVNITRCDMHMARGYIDVHVKGGWVKKTAISAPMAAILTEYLSTRDDDCQALFVNTRKCLLSVSWLQRMVKEVGKESGLSISLTCSHLRHTFATHAADKHGKVITKALMGHQRLTTTEIYTHLSPRHFKSLTNLHPYHQQEGGSNE